MGGCSAGALQTALPTLQPERHIEIDDSRQLTSSHAASNSFSEPFRDCVVSAPKLERATAGLDPHPRPRIIHIIALRFGRSQSNRVVSPHSRAHPYEKSTLCLHFPTSRGMDGNALSLSRDPESDERPASHLHITYTAFPVRDLEREY